MRCSSMISWVALAALCLTPNESHAYVNLSSDGGFLFDIIDSTYGTGGLSNGTTDAYDTCYRLRVGGTDYSVSSPSTTMSLSGRQVEFPESTLAGLQVKRLVYVPSTGGDYARYLEILTNTSTAAVTTTVEVYGNLGSDSSTVLTGDSSGDSTVTTGDLWFSTDDSGDGSGDPSLAHVFQGMSPTTTVTSVSRDRDNINYTWNVTVPAGGRIAVLHFAVQTMNRAGSQTLARSLVELEDSLLTGLDDYLDEIINFSVATPGAPRIRFTGAVSADEGAAIPIDITVEDPEGDTFSFSWDLDDDGMFGENADMSTYTVPAGTTDGPGSVRISVQAVDSAGNISERSRTIQIVNVDPMITSTPPMTSSVGVEYRYQIEVDDPAGINDLPTYTVVTSPPRVSVNALGLLTWTPSESDVTTSSDPQTFRISVNDGDEGIDEQTWELVVSPNRAPAAPMPAYPINLVAVLETMPRLSAQNASDPDYDALTYSFELDNVETFDSEAVQRSEETVQAPGFTSWTPPTPLEIDTRYYWRVRASDGSLYSEWATGSFYVVRDPSTVVEEDAGSADADAGVAGNDAGLLPADAGVPGVEDSGCSIRPQRSTHPAWMLAMMAFVVGGLMRRRFRK